MVELCRENLSVRWIWLYVIIMSRTNSRLSPHTIVCWMSRNYLLEAGAISEVLVTATRFEPKTSWFLNKHSTIYSNRSNDWAVLWALICMVHLTVCYYHVKYESQRESIVCLNVKELLARIRCHIWGLNDSNEIRTQNHLVWKQKLLARSRRLSDSNEIWIHNHLVRIRSLNDLDMAPSDIALNSRYSAWFEKGVSWHSGKL